MDILCCSNQEAERAISNESESESESDITISFFDGQEIPLSVFRNAVKLRK
jgi:hypothetical protein